MRGKKRDIDPPKKSNPKDDYDYPVYDGRAGYYPNPSYKGSGTGREWRTADNAPKEAGRLRLDPRLSRAAHEVGEDIGASDTRIGRSVNTYLDKSRELISEKLAKKYGIKSRGRLSEGEKEFIPKLDNVIDKLSGLSDSDIKELQSQITKLAKPYVDIDKESSKAKQIASAISIASDQDWSAIKPIRERAGLTRDDVLSLIQAPEDSDWVEALAYKAARSAASLKEFQNGGMIKRKDGSYSKRGLWDNIRKNIGSGKKPTKAMLEAEKKINKK